MQVGPGGFQLGKALTSQSGGLNLSALPTPPQLGQPGAGLKLNTGGLGQATGLQVGQKPQGPTPGTGGLQLGGVGLGSGLGASGLTATPSLGLPKPKTTVQTGTLSTSTTSSGGVSGLGSLAKPGLPTLPANLTTGGNTLSTTLPSLKTAPALGGLGKPGLTSTGGLALNNLSTTGGLTTTTVATTRSKGLGGVDPASLSGSGKGPGSRAPMETDLPDVLEQLVANFEQFIKTQKEKSDEISKFSDSGLKKVKQETSSQTQSLGSASTLITKASQVVGHLKSDTVEELTNCKVAQRTNELPAGLQHENTAPDLYFQKLLNSFLAKMELYKREIEALESHLSVATTASGMSPQNIVDILQLQYKPFLILAAQLQTTHEQVQKLKDQYLNYRRIVLQDSTDVFEERRRAAKKAKLAVVTTTEPSSFASTLTQMTAGLTAYPATGVGAGLSGVGAGTGIGGLATGVGKLGNTTGIGALGTNTGIGNLGNTTGIGGLGTGTGIAGLGTGTGIGGLGTGIGGLGAGTGIGGLGTGTGIGGLSTGIGGLGTGTGIGGLGTGTGIGGLGTGIGGLGTGIGGLGTGIGGLGTGTGLPTSGITPGLTLNTGQGSSGQGLKLGNSLSSSMSQPSLGVTTNPQNNLTGGAFQLKSPPLSKKRNNQS